MAKKVLILGGGVAGLSAAHELAEREFEVEIVEQKEIPGGKARSLPVSGSGIGGRKDLPAEHGFRFFPGFYKHLPNTMSRIPFGNGTVADNLVDASRHQIARSNNKNELYQPVRFPSSWPEVLDAFQFFHKFYCDFGIAKSEVSFFIGRLLTLMISCRERRFSEYEHISWMEFVQADQMSSAYKHYLADGLSRSLVALDANRLSTRTGGYILLQFIFDFSPKSKVVSDRVLNGPTNAVWISPWLAYLKKLGVDYKTQQQVVALDFSRGRIDGVLVQTSDGQKRLTADYYISALPVEKLQPLLSQAMTLADPQLAGLQNLYTSWMTGVFFFLKKDVPLVHGHTNYVDSDWALTSISQSQFWPAFDLSDFGDGTSHGVISVIISDWDKPSSHTGKRASESTPQEIIDEVWRQMKVHQNEASSIVLNDSNIARSFISPSVKYDPINGWQNDEPLLINTCGSWKHRPTADTRIPNFFLASDYVQTETDLASMEAANEAARSAVNAILLECGQLANLCPVWPLDEPRFLKNIQAIDKLRWQLGKKPMPINLPVLPWPCP